MTDQRPSEDTELNALFETAKQIPAAPSGSFLTKLAHDMEREATNEARLPVRNIPRPVSWFPRLLAATSLSGAAAAGVWIGFLTPDLLTDPTLLLNSDTTLTLSQLFPAANLPDLTEATLP